MKRVMVLLTVLAMNSLASAEIKISVDGDTGVDKIVLSPSDTVTIGIHNTGSAVTHINFISFLEFYYRSENSYSLSNPRLGPAAGDWPAQWTGPYEAPELDSHEIEFAQMWQTGSTEIPGEMFLIDLQYEGTSGVLVELYDWRPMELVDTLTIVPEPTTIALLGLGALFLRKRKK